MHQNGEDLGTVWANLFVKRDKRKATKFANLIREDYRAFFNPILLGGDAKRDSITGEEILPEERYHTSGGLTLKDITEKQIAKGRRTTPLLEGQSACRTCRFGFCILFSEWRGGTAFHEGEAERIRR